MKILFLGPAECRLVPYLRAQGDEAEACVDRISASAAAGYDFLISYGYRHILKKSVLDLFPRRAINLHISLLPWNRGADPNFWSFVESTPKGVTIHFLDEGVDTGDILVQKEVSFEGPQTLASSYSVLKREIETLFIENWPAIRQGDMPGIPQACGGTWHRLADKTPLWSTLSLGWDTPVDVLTKLPK